MQHKLGRRRRRSNLELSVTEVAFVYRPLYTVRKAIEVLIQTPYSTVLTTVL